MYRLRRPIRRTFWIIGALLVMAMAMLIGALAATTPRLLQGANEALTGAQQLLGDPQGASTKFTQSGQDFGASLAAIRSLPEPAQFPSFIPPFSWYIHLNKAAVYLSRAGADAAELAKSYPVVQTNNDPSALLAAHSAALGQLLANHSDTVNALTTELQRADAELQHVPSIALATKYKELSSLKNQVHILAGGLPNAVQFVTALRHALGEGASDPRTALVLFQNDSELRPSGGFIGSYAVITASSGNIRSFQFGKDIYALDKGYAAANPFTQPPPELLTVTPNWGFRDSNVGAGFLPDLGSQIADFYGKESGNRPNVILLTDLSVLEDVLKLTGPLTLPVTGQNIDSNSVSTVLTTYIDKDYFTDDANKVANAPKSIIGELIPILLDKLRSTPGAIKGIPNVIAKATQRKSLQLWTSDESLTAAAAPLFPADSPPLGDWLKIVNTNLGGKKSSRNIDQKVTITEQVKDGWRNRSVTITRTHNGTGVWPDDENRNYMEVYMPVQAEVLTRPDAKGGESILPSALQKQFNLSTAIYGGELKHADTFTRLGFWATTSVAEQTVFTFTYRVPDAAGYKDTFTYLKQAGARNEHLDAFGFTGDVTGNLTLEKKHAIW